ncbi:tripartite motif-containing protein 16-like [Betta splendens]|uniref:Tripartite motif-containing protein 16-like n=1 Tax=Betta splendens TaxID=158456 RepID=A0A9W2Y5W5_BETSP|nr:tripartite motif-containing protein 16-like [Betta splendens]
MMSEEGQKRTSQAARGQRTADGHHEGTCDYCEGTKRKASKFCLRCQISYCEEHLKDHLEVPALKKHRLLDSSTNPQEMICSQHGEIRNIFCRTDCKCICYLCSMNKHKGHDTVSTNTEMIKRQTEVSEFEENVKENIQDLEKAINQLQQEINQIKCSAEEAVQASEAMCNELVGLIEKKRSEVRNRIRIQQDVAVRRAKEVQNNLENYLSQMKRMETQVEQLSYTKHDITFLQNSHLLPCVSRSTVSAGFSSRPLQYFKDVQTAVSEAKEKIKQLLTKECEKSSKKVTAVDVLLPQYPKTREEFSIYSFPFTLNPNTMHRQLLLSEGNTKVTNVKDPMPFRICSYNEGFRDKCQVLSNECFTGPCYWEVEWSGLAVTVAVSYKNISRLGNEGFGNNKISWALKCSSENYYKFRHNCQVAAVSGPPSSRIGVFLDPGAGNLSFYSVSDTMNLLHRVQTTFTEPLYAGICAEFKGVKAKLILLKNTLAKD